jgi:hypothetical protein
MNSWNKQVVDKRNWGKPSQGAMPSWEGKGAAQPYHAEREAVFPKNETEMNPFVRCCKE